MRGWADDLGVIVLGVQNPRHGQPVKVAQADYSRRLDFNAVESRNQDCQQQSNNCDYDEQFDECECGVFFHFSVAPLSAHDPAGNRGAMFALEPPQTTDYVVTNYFWYIGLPSVLVITPLV